MNTVFDEFHSFWPEQSRSILQPLLRSVYVRHESEGDQHAPGADLTNVVTILRKGNFRDIVGLLEQGYEHCVDETRDDFPHELLASALMVSRPKAFSRNPMAFFGSGFESLRAQFPKIRGIRLKFRSNDEKLLLLDRLGAFLDYNLQLASLKDLCLQAADEMFNNAIFNAPVLANGKRVLQNVSRTEPVSLPPAKAATLFAAFTDHKLIIGCEDLYGSLTKESLRPALHAMFRETTSAPLRNEKGRAGLGFRFMIENSANFYALSTRGVRTLVACGFLLKGMKENLKMAKHIHLNFV